MSTHINNQAQFRNWLKEKCLTVERKTYCRNEYYSENIMSRLHEQPTAHILHVIYRPHEQPTATFYMWSTDHTNNLQLTFYMWFTDHTNNIQPHFTCDLQTTRTTYSHILHVIYRLHEQPTAQILHVIIEYTNNLQLTFYMWFTDYKTYSSHFTCDLQTTRTTYSSHFTCDLQTTRTYSSNFSCDLQTTRTYSSHFTCDLQTTQTNYSSHFTCDLQTTRTTYSSNFTCDLQTTRTTYSHILHVIYKPHEQPTAHILHVIYRPHEQPTATFYMWFTDHTNNIQPRFTCDLQTTRTTYSSHFTCDLQTTRTTYSSHFTCDYRIHEQPTAHISHVIYKRVEHQQRNLMPTAERGCMMSVLNIMQ